MPLIPIHDASEDDRPLSGTRCPPAEISSTVTNFDLFRSLDYDHPVALTRNRHAARVFTEAAKTWTYRPTIQHPFMENQILKLLGRKNYVPANVPELLQHLKLPANQQQRLQDVLAELARTGQIARIKGNRYIRPLEADLIPGRIQITRQGRGFLTPDDEGIPEIAIRSSETGLRSDGFILPS